MLFDDHGTPASGREASRRAAGHIRLWCAADRLCARLPDAAALAGTQMSYYQQHLGRVSLQAQPFTAGAPEITAARIHRGSRPLSWPGCVTVLATTSSLPPSAAPAMMRRPPWRALEGGQLDAAYLDPVSAVMVAQVPVDTEMAAAGGRVFPATARTPGNAVPTVVLTATKNYLTDYPAALASLIQGQLQADKQLTASPVPAESAFQQKLVQAGNAALPPAVLTGSFAQVTFTDNPRAPQIGPKPGKQQPPASSSPSPTGPRSSTSQP
jgi:hypothetical protein